MLVRKVEISSREKNQVPVMFDSLRMENGVETSDMSVVCEFPDVSLKIFVTCQWKWNMGRLSLLTVEST